MADIRVNVGRRSREIGERVGVQVSVFGMQKLAAGVTGEALARIGMDAMRPAFDEAYNRWPVLTGASRDSIELGVSEEEEHRARVVLQAGGIALITDPRNKSRKDYAPFIEFNGTATAPPAILRDAVYGQDRQIRQSIHSGVERLIAELLI